MYVGEETAREDFRVLPAFCTACSRMVTALEELWVLQRVLCDERVFREARALCEARVLRKARAFNEAWVLRKARVLRKA